MSLCRGTATRPGSWGIANSALFTLSGVPLWILKSEFHFHSHDNSRTFHYLHYADRLVDFQEKEIISLMSHRKQEVASLAHSEPSGGRHRPLRREAVELVQTEVQLPQGPLP